jgi:hypothetical protein
MPLSESFWHEDPKPSRPWLAETDLKVGDRVRCTLVDDHEQLNGTVAGLIPEKGGALVLMDKTGQTAGWCWSEMVIYAP